MSQPGDLWLLGRHRLLCGDATREDSFEHLLDGHRAQMVFTDPPYNVPIDGHASGLGDVRHREFAMASGEMSEAEFTAFLEKIFRSLVSIDQTGRFTSFAWIGGIVSSCFPPAAGLHRA